VSGAGWPSKDQTLGGAPPTAPGDQVEIEGLDGNVAEALLAIGGRTGAALLAVGSRGRGPVKAAVLGSVSSDVIRKADRPVMVVSSAAA
jgi:nucleotide-binding universal stress UspA family protein